MKRFYAGQSQHGGPQSYGFANDWTVYCFEDRKSRDKFVEQSHNLSCIEIKAKDVTYHAANWSLTQNREIRPRPFTTEFWGIVNYGHADGIDGCIGTVEVVNSNDWDVNRYLVCPLRNR